VNVVAALAYVVIALGALLLYAYYGHDTKLWSYTRCQRILLILIALVVSAGPPAWFWAEARAFDY
jgi:hypothetical protein